MTSAFSWRMYPASMFFAWMFFFSGPALAENVDWGSATGGVNLDSNGSPMNADFQFQVGVFSHGFTPSIGNLAYWDDHWVPAQTVAYIPASSRFNGIFAVEDNDPPFTAGTPAWILGRKVTATGTEAILLRRPSWTWPVPTFFNPEGPIWRVDGDANIHVVIGSVNPDGMPFLMQSEVVRDYSQWSVLNLQGEPLNDPHEDPDGDGVPNFLEFVFGTNPLDAASRAAAIGGLVEADGQRFLQISAPRVPTHVARLTAQVSTDLVDWLEGPDHIEVIENSALGWIMRDKTALENSGGRRFIRLRASE